MSLPGTGLLLTNLPLSADFYRAQLGDVLSGRLKQEATSEEDEIIQFQEGDDIEVLSLNPWDKSLREQISDLINKGDTEQVYGLIADRLLNADELEIDTLLDIAAEAHAELHAQNDPATANILSHLLKDWGVELEAPSESAPEPALAIAPPAPAPSAAAPAPGGIAA
jgi:hypothetical protein